MVKKILLKAVCHKKNKGMAIFTVLGIIAVMAVLGVMAQKFSLSQRRQVVKGVSDTQADFLLKAAIEIALSKSVDEANAFDSAKASKMLKAPMQKGAQASGTRDCELTIPSDILLSYDKNDIKLEQLASAMGISIESLNINFKLSTARSIESDDDTFEVIGLEKKPFMRPPTLQYVKYNTISPWQISLPSFKLSNFLNFKASIAIFPAPIPAIPVPLPIGDCLEIILGTVGVQLPEIELNKIFNMLFGSLFGCDFPIDINININTGNIPTYSSLWPSTVTYTPPAGEDPPADWVCEKYGLVEIYAEIEIKGTLGKYKRGASTSVEFKVADCQPPAALYSFFVENTSNSMSPDVFRAPSASGGDATGTGRRLYINSTSFEFYKRLVKSGATTFALNIDDPNSANIPGLMRVNGNSTYPINLSWFKPSLAYSPGFNPLEMAKEFSGLTLDIGKAIPQLSANTLAGIGISSIGSVIGSIVGGFVSAVGEWLNPDDDASTEDKESIWESIKNFSKDNWKTWLAAGASKWTWPVGHWPSLLTNMTKGGFDLNLVCLPYPFESGNVTFPFGEFYIYPPLWREIEGKVTKRVAKWNFYLITGIFAPGDTMAAGIPLVIPITWIDFDDSGKYTYNSQVKVPSLGGTNLKDDTSIPSFLNDSLSSLKNNFAGGIQSDSSPVLPPTDCRDTVECNYQTDKKYGATALYSKDHYKKKATLYYTDQDSFKDDFNNYYDGSFFNPPGVIYLDYANAVFPPSSYAGANLQVSGRGMVVADGNLKITKNIYQGEWNSTPEPVNIFSERRKNTTFTLMAMDGMLQFESGSSQIVEASCYGYQGLQAQKKLKIIGNFVCDVYSNSGIGEEVVIDYQSTRTRCSYFSTKPCEGKFDPRRYNLSFGQRSNISYKLQAN